MWLRILPHPLLSITIAAVWVLLANDGSSGSIFLAALVGIVVPKLTSAYWLGRPRIRHPLLVLGYIAVMVYDIVLANIQVAWLVLFRRGDGLRSGLIAIPLELRSPEAITALAGTITLTPGTLTADVSDDRRFLLVHCLEVADPAAAVQAIKDRYERRLKRIFE
jgi:multicomponent K+:H+ antiporter subunit E